MRVSVHYLENNFNATSNFISWSSLTVESCTDYKIDDKIDHRRVVKKMVVGILYVSRSKMKLFTTNYDNFESHMENNDRKEQYIILLFLYSDNK